MPDACVVRSLSPLILLSLPLMSNIGPGTWDSLTQKETFAAALGCGCSVGSVGWLSGLVLEIIYPLSLFSIFSIFGVRHGALTRTVATT